MRVCQASGWRSPRDAGFFIGVFGAHRFYVGKHLTGILMLITFGWFGIWWLVDLIMLITGQFRDKEAPVTEW